MAARNYLLLFILALCVILSAAIFETSPGYMDAEYYYSGGLQLSRGNGFQENYLWNFLDNPQGIPHPANTYWMPLASLLAAIAPAVVGHQSFALARIPFILIGAAVSPVTAALAFRLTKKKSLAILAGVFAAFPGYYLAYLPTTDTFGLYMLLGAGFFALAAWMNWSGRLANYPYYFLLGSVAGLMHLARADGLLWLGFALVLLPVFGRKDGSKTNGAGTGSASGNRLFLLLGGEVSIILGYLLVMAPWWLRNLNVYGQLMVPGASRVLWEREYNELFSFPADRLSFITWWAQGIGPILQPRWEALIANLKSTVGVEGEILLLPFILLGLWAYRKERLVRLAVIAWCGTLLVMSFIYPFAGARGGFFHSGAAIQPVLWTAAAVGFAKAVEWAGKKRGWIFKKAYKNFAIEFVMLIVLLTGFLGYRLILGSDVRTPIWNQGNAYYTRIESSLHKFDPGEKAAVLVNNPAGYSLVSSRPALAIPNGDIQTLLSVADRYHAEFVIIDQNLPTGLLPILEDPENQPRLTLEARIGETMIFSIGKS